MSRAASQLRSLLPTEHGGWAIVGESVVLGLLVKPSLAGTALGIAAFVLFITRTSLKLVLVDLFRARWLQRTTFALSACIVELAVLAILVVLTLQRTTTLFWQPLFFALPPFLVALFYDMRSRSRRLLPELVGAIGMNVCASVIALAGGSSWRVAMSLWFILALRNIAAIPYVRVRVHQLRASQQQHISNLQSDSAQIIVLLVCITSIVTKFVPLFAVLPLAIFAVFHLIDARRAPRAAKRIGFQQVAIGVTVLSATALALR